MNKRKLISFIESKGIYSDELNLKIDNSTFNLTDVILMMLSEKLNLNNDELTLEYEKYNYL